MNWVKKYKLYIVLLVVMLFSASLFLFGNKNKIVLGGFPEIVYVKIGNAEVYPILATSTHMQIVGLSGKNNIKENSGMLFEFATEDYYGVWMKEMRFAIDILWADKDMKIIYIEKNIKPDTYPNIFSPREVARYVLEVPSGFVAKHNIKIGDTFFIKRK